MKTGALIRTAIEGAAVICTSPPEMRQNLREFGEQLGLAFQLADDILDYQPQAPEKSGFPYLMGLDRTKSKLHQTTQKALLHLNPLGPMARELKILTEWNVQRAGVNHESP